MIPSTDTPSGSALPRALVALLALALVGCASTPRHDEPTLESLGARPSVKVDPSRPVDGAVDRTVAAYEAFLRASPSVREKPEAERRLADLSMRNADAHEGAGEATQASRDLAAAISRYRAYLDAYPARDGNDDILYQLAHAYEQSGDLASALATLEKLVTGYPHTPHLEEAQFRRGEMRFATRDYEGAEKAYGTIINTNAYSPYYQRSLYMAGWSVFKQGRFEDALRHFLSVLDLKLIGRQGEVELDHVEGLSRADRELIEDTLRVSSLCLENLQGADSIPAFMTGALREDYEYRLYSALADLYIKQERIKDAADTLATFATRHPLSPQAPLLQARVIYIFEANGFGSLALDGKKVYVERYGARQGEFRTRNPEAWSRTQPQVRTFLGDLARNAHSLSQKSHRPEDVELAVHWYRELLEDFPADVEAPHNTFLLGELLFENGRFGQAAEQYEKAAYGFGPSEKGGKAASDAGYAALLSYRGQEKQVPEEQRNEVALAGIRSAQRFADAFRHDPRVATVLVDAADRLFGLHDFTRAQIAARRALAADPPATDAQKRTAWLIIGHSSFDLADYPAAEKAYQEVLLRTPATDPGRGELVERQAASVYREGEKAREAGKFDEAARAFDRVAEVAPASPIRATAQFDAAGARMQAKDWSGAARTLEDFRTRFPGHALQPDVTEKLAVVWFAAGEWKRAGAEFERLASTRKDPKEARAALWQAAEMYVRSGDEGAAQRGWEGYVKAWPAPLADAEEARSRLGAIARHRGDRPREIAIARDILQADQAGGAERTERTRYLAAGAALMLAEPVHDEYAKVALVEPLKKQLKLKKAKFEDVLKAYALAADYGVADVATAATHHTAELYRDFGKSMLASERPKGLSKDELEQYNVLLEEQAFPFEEKAIELHEVNARRSARGIYDEWVRASFTALAQMRPVRYGKIEQSEPSVHAIR